MDKFRAFGKALMGYTKMDYITNDIRGYEARLKAYGVDPIQLEEYRNQYDVNQLRGARHYLSTLPIILQLYKVGCSFDDIIQIDREILERVSEETIYHLVLGGLFLPVGLSEDDISQITGVLEKRK